MYVFIKALKKAYEGLRLIGGTFEPDDIFKNTGMKADLIESLDLVNTTLGEDLVKQKLLTDSQLANLKVLGITEYVIIYFLLPFVKLLSNPCHCVGLVIVNLFKLLYQTK